jgi:FKBP-type peptidyl-prolyl cis-trans isomerase
MSANYDQLDELVMDKYTTPFAIAMIAVVILYFYTNSTSSKNAEKNASSGIIFLELNRAKEGIIETKSGLQYVILKHGKGTQHPKASDRVTVHYHGTLLDGTVFDSSVERNKPISFKLSQVIKGWTEGVQLMVVGDKFRFFIPSKLAYGNRSAGKIDAGSTLIFEVELLGINQ